MQVTNYQFRFTPMFNNVGVAASSGIVCGMIIAVSVLPTIVLQLRGHVWRRKLEDVAYE
jgi:uncharacterized membrane protein YdfJ with MMPL/SSD domain